MSEHPQLARTSEYFETFARGDLQALSEFFSDDVIWHVAGRHPLSGDYHGKAQMLDYLERARELSGGSLTLEPTSILANDDHVALFVRVRAQRGDRTLDVEMAQVFDVRPDGTWSEFWSMPDDQDAIDAFWADVPSGVAS